MLSMTVSSKKTLILESKRAEGKNVTWKYSLISIYALIFTHENEIEECEYKSKNEEQILRNTFVICIVSM